jgi:ABC-type sugar transport system permease subunit
MRLRTTTLSAETGAPPPGGQASTWPPVRLRRLSPLLWIGPTLVLIAGVMIWPTVEMIRTSLLKLNIAGDSEGFAGVGNYRRLFTDPQFVGVLLRTVIWVVVVVAVTIFISLALAALLNSQFWGRKVVRWAVIVPWAASGVMTAIIWRWMLNYFYGLVNRVLLSLGLIHKSIDWLGEPHPAFIWMIACAVFISLPFTSYVLLSGMQGVSTEALEAARVDGASSWRTYVSIVLPALRPALLVALVINFINVFNSFPIIWTITEGGPGDMTDTTTTFMYKLAFQNQQLGESGALAVVNFVIVLVVVAAYLAFVRRDWEAES